MTDVSPPPFTLFDIEADLGIPAREFLAFLVPTFSALHLDRYDAKRGKVEYLQRAFPKEARRLEDFLPRYYRDDADLMDVLDLVAALDPASMREFDRIGVAGRRKRAIAKLIVADHSGRGGDGWEIERIASDAFRQNVDRRDVRSLERRFWEAAPSVIAHPHMHALIRGIADMTRTRRPDAEVLRMTFHQMFAFADVLSAGTNAPEGIHQDGVDYVVSAIAVERVGIVGGESIIYASDKSTELLRCTLRPGLGLFQDDTELWHDVTPILEDPEHPTNYGHRSIIGFDIEVLG